MLLVLFLGREYRVLLGFLRKFFSYGVGFFFIKGLYCVFEMVAVVGVWEEWYFKVKSGVRVKLGNSCFWNIIF